MSTAATLPGLGFLSVSEHTARNPVARAIARRRVQLAALDFQLRLYGLEAGTYVASDALAAADVLMVAYGVLEQRGQTGHPPARVIQGAMSCLTQLAERGFRWRTVDAGAIDAALMHAVEVFNSAKTQETEAAWLKCRRVAK